MKNLTKLMMAASLSATVIVSSCRKDQQIDAPEGNFERGTTAGFSKPQKSVPTDATGKINSSITLDRDTVWKLDGIVYVTNNATLTIQSGTILTRGTRKPYTDQNGNTRNIGGVLVITKGAKINAIGTPTRPIVFTSPNDPNVRKAGDFGGLILLGDAPTNKPTTQTIEGLPANPPADITYGGSDAADNSGRLSYVRVEFPGFKLFNDNEINGITFGGVGEGTVVDHVEVAFSADDGFEFFGGTVNANYLVAVGNDDDDFDFDFGYRGTLQFGLALKVANTTHSKSSSNPNASDANGIESDNDGAGSTATPITRPVIGNFTVLGFASKSTKPDTLKNGVRFRRNTSVNMKNSIIGGFPLAASFENGTESRSDVSYSNNTSASYVAKYLPDPPPAFVSGVGNRSFISVSTADTDLKLGGSANPFYSGSYNPLNAIPDAGGPSVGRGAVSSSNVSNFQTWTNYNPRTTVY